MSTEPAAAPVPDAARSHGRAGRDLPAAIAVGVTLGGAVVASLLLWKPAFVALAVVVIVLAVWELATALATRGIMVPLVPALLGSVLIVVGAYSGGATTHAVVLGLTVLAIAVWRLGERDAGYLRDLAGGTFAVVYVPFLAGFAMLLLRLEDGPARVFALFLVVVGSDVGGYAAGVLFGRHPMAPSVSPKKSWEGFAGSVLLGVGAGVATVVLLLDGPWWAGAVLGLAGVLTATVGDLGESAVKRDLKVKDMSSLLPGHGGLMDRLDSLLPSAAITWIVLSALVPPG